MNRRPAFSPARCATIGLENIAARPATPAGRKNGMADNTPPPVEATLDDPDLRRHPLAARLAGLYRFGRMRRLVRKAALKLEGGEFYSATLRRLLWRHHKILVGAYSYGPWYDPVAFLDGVSVGRYVSVGSGVRVVGANHPLDWLSTHPFFFNPDCGLVDEIKLGDIPVMRVEHDAWIGANALFTPGCRRVGLGAVVGGAAVVTRDVPDFAVVAGNPARVLRQRFPDAVADAVRESRWWERSVEECRAILPAMTSPLDVSTHPFFRK